jgi:hypothetical protein
MLLRGCLVLGLPIALAANALAQLSDLRPDDVLQHLRSPENVSVQTGLAIIPMAP